MAAQLVASRVALSSTQLGATIHRYYSTGKENDHFLIASSAI
jgi:hypothetical protein